MENHPRLHATMGSYKMHLVDGKKAQPRLENWNIIASLNEGFADLFAYYSSNESFPGIEGMPCMMYLREPNEKYLENFPKIKAWTPELVEFLFDQYSTNPISDDAGCRDFSLESPHGLGAIFAHTIDKIFSTRSDLGTGEQVSINKTKMSIELLDRLDRDVSLADLGPRTLTFEILLTALDLTREGESVFYQDSQQCAVAKEYLSAWEDSLAAEALTSLCFN